MKRVLIISPYFPPSNAADMQRIRMSLPFFGEFGWEAEVVTVAPRYSEMVKDELLLKTIPDESKIHQVNALPKQWTSKLGLGSLALRSMWHYRKKVNQLLKQHRYDLIYFSTTQFPVCILGAYWRKRFGVPYVIDMQDPWHSDYYRNKPPDQRPAKYWFSYRLNKYLEPIAMKSVSGLISVSAAYIDTLGMRYPRLKSIPLLTLTFGAFYKDFDVAENNDTIQSAVTQEDDYINVVYIGRGGYDMQPALRLLFTAFKQRLSADRTLFSKLRFYFIGTSYAAEGQGRASVLPVAREYDVQKFVTEQTGRIPYFQSIKTLLAADALVVPGSDDPQYTASKIYPCILAKKPLLGIFNSASSAANVITSCKAGTVADLTKPAEAITAIVDFLQQLAAGSMQPPQTDMEVFEEFSARNMTRKQCGLFNQVVEQK